MIYIDYRECQPHKEQGRTIDNHIRELNVQVEKIELQSGDFEFTGNGPNGPVVVLIERKKIRDLIGSIRSRRLAGLQLPNMLRSADIAYLLIEESYRPDPSTGTLQTMRRSGWEDVRLGNSVFQYNEVDRFLWTWTEFGGIRVLRSATIKESARMIANLHHQWQKKWEDHKGWTGFYNLPDPEGLARRVVAGVVERPGTMQRMLKEIEGIGWEKSGPCAARFKTMREAVCASEKEWREIEGIGKTLAARAVRELGGDPEGLCLVDVD